MCCDDGDRQSPSELVEEESTLGFRHKTALNLGNVGSLGSGKTFEEFMKVLGNVAILPSN